jgi:CRP-like cAMP-binding protein
MFQKIETRALEKLSLLSEVVVYTADDIIESHGQIASGLYVIVQGSVQISNAKIMHTRELLQNDYFGQTALFRDEVRVGTVVALEVAEIVHLMRQSLERLTDVYPGLKVEMSTIATRLSNDEYRILYTTKEMWEKEYQLATDDDLRMLGSLKDPEDSAFGLQF